MKKLADHLRNYVQSGKLIGFCPWEDGGGTLWGRILDVTHRGFRLQYVDPLGRDEEVKDYLFSEIIYFIDEDEYPNRLLLLADFKPTLPEEYVEIRDKEEIQRILKIAFESSEIIRISIPGEENIIVRIKELEDNWIEFTYFLDTMAVGGSQWVKIDCILDVRWRNARTEADEYLLIKGKSQD